MIQEVISKPSIEDTKIMMVIEGEDWRSPITKYLRSDTLPPERDEANKLRKTAEHYTLVGDKLYKRGFSAPLLLCVGEQESQRILKEIHEGSC